MLIKCTHYDASHTPQRFNPARITVRRISGRGVETQDFYVCELCSEELRHFFALRTGPTRCDCGAQLAHVTGLGATGVLCPECDRESLREHQEFGEVEHAKP